MLSKVVMVVIPQVRSEMIEMMIMAMTKRSIEAFIKDKEEEGEEEGVGNRIKQQIKQQLQKLWGIIRMSFSHRL
jgi:seryl-tRNA(Sec) selenium transferase